MVDPKVDLLASQMVALSVHLTDSLSETHLVDSMEVHLVHLMAAMSVDLMVALMVDH